MVDSVMLRFFEGDALRGNADTACGMALPESQAGSGSQADRFSPFTFHFSLFTSWS